MMAAFVSVEVPVSVPDRHKGAPLAARREPPPICGLPSVRPRSSGLRQPPACAAATGIRPGSRVRGSAQVRTRWRSPGPASLRNAPGRVRDGAGSTPGPQALVTTVPGLGLHPWSLRFRSPSRRAACARREGPATARPMSGGRQPTPAPGPAPSPLPAE